MSINIRGFIKSLLPSFSKSDIENDLEISLESIPVIIESYNNLSNVLQVAEFKHKDSKKLVDEFYKEFNKLKTKVKLRKKDLGADTVTLFNNAKVNGEWTLKVISDSVNDVIMSQALTAYHANLLRAVPQFYFICRYSMDFLSYLYVKECEVGGLEPDRDFLLNKKQEEFVEKNVAFYARILAVFGETHSAYLDNVDAVSKVILPPDEVDKVAEMYKSDKIDLFDNLPNGFVGSPIYSIRLVFAEWEADRYRSLKDKKRLLELRYLHYKLLKEQGASDVNTEKEISHLQKRLTDLDFKIAKIEQGID